MAMNVVLAIFADGERAIIVINREAVQIHYFLLYFIDSDKTLQWWPLPTPCEEAPGGAVCGPSKPCRWRGKRLHHGGDVCVIVFSLLKPSEQEFFVPARTDWGVKLLIYSDHNIDTVVGENKINNEKCRQIAGNIDCHADAAIQCRVHHLMEHIQGFTWSHWMPS